MLSLRRPLLPWCLLCWCSASGQVGIAGSQSSLPQPSWLTTTTSITSISGQAFFCRRRHQPRSPPHAKSRPGSPALTIGPGTATGTKTIYAGAQRAMQVDRNYTNFVSSSISSEIMAHVGIPPAPPRDRSALGALRFPWGRPANTGVADLTRTERVNECS